MRSTLVASSLRASCTFNLANSGLKGSWQYQRKAPCASVMASLYSLPAERSLAARATTSNWGCPARDAKDCCPATPVAPMTATFFFFMAFPQKYRLRLGKRGERIAYLKGVSILADTTLFQCAMVIRVNLPVYKISFN